MSRYDLLSFPIANLIGETAASHLVQEIDKMNLEQLFSSGDMRI